jgi:hypothetical protein
LAGNNSTFDSAAFLASAGLGRKIVELRPQQTFFCQGDTADSVFYLQNGRVRVTVVSQRGKEATITILSATDFVGEESLAAIVGLRIAHVDRHRNQLLHGTKDRQKQDDPCDA